MYIHEQVGAAPSDDTVSRERETVQPEVGGGVGTVAVGGALDEAANSITFDSARCFSVKPAAGPGARPNNRSPFRVEDAASVQQREPSLIEPSTD
jgi:hypothetical protein